MTYWTVTDKWALRSLAHFLLSLYFLLHLISTFYSAEGWRKSPGKTQSESKSCRNVVEPTDWKSWSELLVFGSQRQGDYLLRVVRTGA